MRGCRIIAPRRSNIAHLRRPRRANVRFCTILFDFSAADPASVAVSSPCMRMLQRSMRVVPMIIGDSYRSWAGFPTAVYTGQIGFRLDRPPNINSITCDQTSDGLTVVLAERLREGEPGRG
jgi:hypothetical protein